VAHALESVANYKIAHGEAVAIGLLAESYLSMRLGLLPQNPFQEIEARITGANFPLRLPSNYNRTSFLHAMQHDKKNAKGVVRFTLLTHIGGAGAFDGQYCRPVSEEALQEMSEWMERL
jgi:3-dehydroquinate synthetase